MQVQAIVAATVVSIFAIVVNTITDRAINPPYILLLIASAVFTATTTCFVLGKLSVQSTNPYWASFVDYDLSIGR